MKPIRAYDDGQWLLLLWAFIVFFLIAGLFLGITALVVVALLGGAGAGYTTYLYVNEKTGGSGSSSGGYDSGGYGSDGSYDSDSSYDPDSSYDSDSSYGSGSSYGSVLRTVPVARTAPVPPTAPALRTTPTTEALVTTLDIPSAAAQVTGEGGGEAVIGLETHVELGTASKMFCGCATDFGAEPNSHTCPVCLALPGALPVVNERAIEFAVRIGLALNCDIASWCRFARKNYFYPDMPKNFQISQYDEPLCAFGHLDVEVDGEVHRVGITRVHLEEDTGKSLHVGGSTGRIHGATHSLMDYNRAGVPLVEIVTEPDIRSAAVAKAYLAELRDLLRSLGVSEARMEQGQMRCDANVSLRRRGTEPFGTRTETKNLNSLRSVERAADSEIVRQAEVLTGGGRIVQETRHFDEAAGRSSSGRVKEEATDYRYFPEPDLTPMALPREQVEAIRATLPELPAQRRARLQEEFGYSALDLEQMRGAGVLDLVQDTIAAGAPPDAARSWWLNEPLRSAADTEGLPIRGTDVARIVELVAEGKLTNALARQVVEGMLAGEGSTDEVVANRGLALERDDDALGMAVDDAIAGAPDLAEKVRGGKLNAVGPLVGGVMKAMRGKADAAQVKALLLQKLGVG